MKKIFLLIVMSFLFSNAHLYICDNGVRVWGCEIQVDLCYTSTIDIDSFQFRYEPGNSCIVYLDYISDPLYGSTIYDPGAAVDYGFAIMNDGIINPLTNPTEYLVIGVSTGQLIPATSSLNEHLLTMQGAFDCNGCCIDGDMGPLLTNIPSNLGGLDGFYDINVNTIPSTAAYTTWDCCDDNRQDCLLDVETPIRYNLSEAYPNPFNPTTTIDYNVEVAGNVSIIVYDLMGREVKTLVNEFKSPSNGGYSVKWDGVNNQGDIITSGMYIYKMISNNFIQTNRLTFIK